MSLLLDALKKAADDKQKASRGESFEAQASEKIEQTNEQIPTSVSDGGAQSEVEELSLQAIEKNPAAPEQPPVSDAEALTLDIENDGGDKLTLTDRGITGNEPNNKVAPVEAGNAVLKNNKGNDRGNNNDHNASGSRSGTSKFTVSDDALSLLIDKTNRDVKQSKRIFMISVVIASLTILLSGGLYYYTDMQAEIASIERKHQIAMLSMRLKTNAEKTPDKSAIIRNLVSDAELEEKVQYAKAHMSSKKKAVNTRVQTKSVPAKKMLTAGLSIKKTNKSDPVGEKLDTAWLAYENGSYDKAKQLYKDTLRIEGDNRDAQLGLGAIAVIEKDDVRARKIYLSLLQQDPRDPIAIAALTGLSADKSSLQSDNDYLLSMLKKNPDAPQLNFSLGNNYAQQNKWKPAQQYYFKAWQLDDENADYIFNLAVSMDQLGKPQQAISFYKDSLNKSTNRQVSFSREAVQKRINELAGL